VHDLDRAVNFSPLRWWVKPTAFETRKEAFVSFGESSSYIVLFQVVGTPSPIASGTGFNHSLLEYEAVRRFSRAVANARLLP